MSLVKLNANTQIQWACEHKCREDDVPYTILTPGRIASPLKDEIKKELDIRVQHIDIIQSLYH